MKIFVINLDSSRDRLSRITNQLNKLNVEFQRIPAVCGKHLSDDDVSNVTYPINHVETKTRFTRALTKGEIGCFLSHKICWQLLVESTDQRAVILEDDIEISPKASKYLQNDKWLPADVKLCQLNVPYDGKKGRIDFDICPIDENIRLVRPLYPTPVGGFAYIISREVAAEALSLSTRLPAPVDDFLFSPWFTISTKYVLWRTDPGLVIPSSNTLSDIGDRSKRSVIKAPFFIRHSLKRFLLDRKIKKFQHGGQSFVFKYWR